MSIQVLRAMVFGIFLAAACGPADTGDGELTEPPDGACTAGEVQCNAGAYQVCDEGEFRTQENCLAACDATLGCVDCTPNGSTCVGDAVHSCNADGTVGDSVQTCDPGQCTGGFCAADDCAQGAELVYVVDQDYNLLSFDPVKLDAGQEPFTSIGQISCPTQASSYGNFGNPPTPFSMSVDRNAVAWVLFTSGELFHVSTEDASCTPINYARGQQNFELFGMGFVSDSAGSSEETLWVAGGRANRTTIGDLASIDTGTLTLAPVASLPNDPANSPELTGTGNGELFGFYPGDAFTQSQIGHINKGSAGHDETWRFNDISDAAAWAFAHWGGNFYIFVTEREIFSENSQVLFFDRMTGQTSVRLQNLPYKIVGAGVSTCAPVIVD